MTPKSASRNRSGPGAVSLPSPHGGPSISRRMTRPSPVVSFLFTFIVLACAVTPTHAQSSKIFQWQFSQSLSQSLPSCRSLGVQVKPFDPNNLTHGVPPFYMAAFPVNGKGVPSTTFIGKDERNLAWTVNQPVGAELLLYVLDSQGSSGGVPPDTFTVTSGASTQCIPAASSDPPFTVTANVTDTLNTCQPWGLTIVGGTPPYNLTLAAINSPVVTNVTLGPNDDAFTFINRADPDTKLIAAISDLNGRWASGTPIVKTAGSSNVDCVGLVSKSSTAQEIKAAAALAAKTEKARKQTAVIAGVVVTLVVLLLLAGVGVFLYLRRRKMLARADKTTPRQFEGGVAGVEPTPPTYTENGTHILSINSFIHPPSPTDVPKSPSLTNYSSPTQTVQTSVQFDQQRLYVQDAASVRSDPISASSHGPGTGGGSGLSVRNPHPHRPAAFSSFPTASVRRSAKSIEASMSSSVGEDSEFYDPASSSPTMERSLSASAGPAAERLPSPNRSMSTGAPAQEIIYQHQDAGIVRELPPPYMGPPQP